MLKPFMFRKIGKRTSNSYFISIAHMNGYVMAKTLDIHDVIYAKLICMSAL